MKKRYSYYSHTLGFLIGVIIKTEGKKVLLQIKPRTHEIWVFRHELTPV